MWQSQNHPLTAPVDDIGDEIKSYKFNLSSVYRRAVSDKFGLKIRTSYFRNYWKDYFHDNNDYSRAQKLGFEIQGDYLYGQHHSLTFGSEEVYDHVKSNMFDNHDSYGLSFYAQDEIKILPILLLTVGARYDFNHVDTGLAEDQLSPKIGLVWHATSLTTLRVSSGRGFRAPSVAERFTDVVVSGLRIVPSLDLKAESAWSHEIGIHQILSTFMMLDVATFHSDYWDLIEPEPDASGTVQFINVTRARIRGVESSLQFSLFRNHLTGSLGATILDPKDLDLNDVLAYRAKYLFTGSITYTYGAFQTGFDYRYVSRLDKTKVYPRDERVPQKILDFRVGYKLGRYNIAADVDNLFNYNYTQIERTLMPIRKYSVTVSAGF